MWPEIPADLTELSNEDLMAFRAEAKKFVREHAASFSTPDEITAAETLLAAADQAKIVLQARALSDLAVEDEATDEVEAEVEAEVELAAETEVDETETVEAEDEAATEVEAEVEEAADDTTDTPDTTVEAEMATKPAPRRTFGASKPAPAAAPARRAFTPYDLVAVDHAEGVAPGERFSDWGQVARAAAEIATRISPRSERRFEVARVLANYPEERVLSADPTFNLAKFEQDELTAAMCAPLPPVYELVGANSIRRPVFNSLPQFAAPRGGASIYPSPSLSDIDVANDIGVGIWTSEDDADVEAVKNDCATISCASPTEYRIYGVYRCLTVKNLLAMTYPELVEAYLNRLHAAHSRLAEKTLLQAMGSATTLVNAPSLGYGGSVSVTSTILNYIALWQEIERWDAPALIEGWAPRWVAHAMKMDIARRNNAYGDRVRVPSDADIVALFREVGVNIHFFMDTPSWASVVPDVQTAGVLNTLPGEVDILLAPPGKFAVMDRGELAIGVTGNGLYRDNSSNSKNEFTFFFENFEGIIDTNNLPAHRLRIPTCWNGAQIAPVSLDCEGADYAGVGS